MYLHIHVYMHIYIYVCLCCIPTYAPICLHTHVAVCTSICTAMCIYAYTHVGSTLHTWMATQMIRFSAACVSSMCWLSCLLSPVA